MIIANLLGSICLSTNLMFSRSLKSSNLLLSACLIRKFLSCKPIGGGEYQKLNSYFGDIGIVHQVSCPHAHQHNGLTKCKHHHIVNVGLSLLGHAHMPLKYFDEAFLAATYLINHLPTKVLQFSTPLELLFKDKPNYDGLRTFGSVCWPNLRPLHPQTSILI
jgi:hypothetical protein